MLIQYQQVSAEHPCFAGHFPGNPLVPGALLLSWVAAYFQVASGGELVAIRNAKFLRPVRPGDQLTYEFDVKSGRPSTGTVCPEAAETQLPENVFLDGAGVGKFSVLITGSAAVVVATGSFEYRA
ncbi:3-hydroxyacyl-ACP dehydratase FabZ family protein [Teredinibacter turnerae]|uniref:3-hydroxyacyl-ACP dehydratase FabZ family protein n=1 Tax=Teredinibacter turnerae TaxID=2426 RepID=UPI0004071CA7|nr:3-hydroxyacyl-ACP dehydratase FabZ family protein [Teredinibacter turnerae]